MVTVVATQELEAGDVLRRFKAESAQDEPRRGNNNKGYISSIDWVLLTCLLYFSCFVVVFGRACVYVSVMFEFL